MANRMATRALLIALCILGCMLPFADSIAAGTCKVCASASLGGQCVEVAEGATLDLATVGLKDKVNSLKLNTQQSLQY